MKIFLIIKQSKTRPVNLHILEGKGDRWAWGAIDLIYLNIKGSRISEKKNIFTVGLLF